MKPCDCKSGYDVNHLTESGVMVNNHGISVKPNVVILTMDHTTVKISMKEFKLFAEWYLEDQEFKNMGL